jgi:hypothetical protein
MFVLCLRLAGGRNEGASTEVALGWATFSFYKFRLSQKSSPQRLKAALEAAFCFVYGTLKLMEFGATPIHLILNSFFKDGLWNDGQEVFEVRNVLTHQSQFVVLVGHLHLHKTDFAIYPNFVTNPTDFLP